MRAAKNLEKRFSSDNISSYIIAHNLDQKDKSHGQDQNQDQDHGDHYDHNYEHNYNQPISSTRDSDSFSCHSQRNPCPCFIYLSKQIEMLQRDLNTAAEVGKALLKTHEDYVLESEQEAAQMEESINSMTENLQSVMQENDKLLSDNSDLINQLQENSQALKKSDSRIENLSLELNASKDRIIKLNTFMMQAKELETQIISLENIRESLQNDLQQTTKEKYLAELKWRKTERLLEKLTNQYEKLEDLSYEREVAPRLAFLNDQSIKRTISELQRKTLGDSDETEVYQTISSSTPIKNNPEVWSSDQANQFQSLPSPPSSGRRSKSHIRTNSNIGKLGPLYEDDSFRDYFHFGNPSNVLNKDFALSSPLHSRHNSHLAGELPTPTDSNSIGLVTPNDTVDTMDTVDTVDDMVDDMVDDIVDGTLDDTLHNEKVKRPELEEDTESVDNSTELSTDDSIEQLQFFGNSNSSAQDSLDPPNLRKVASHESVLSVLMENYHHSRQASTTTAIDLSPAIGSYRTSTIVPSFYARTKLGIAVTEVSAETTIAPPSKLLNPEYSKSLRSRQLLTAAIANNNKKLIRPPVRSNSIDSISQPDSSAYSEHDRSTTWSNILSRLRKSSNSTPSTAEPSTSSPATAAADILISRVLADPIQTKVCVSDVSDAMNTSLL